MTAALLILLATVALIALIDYIPRLFNAAKTPIKVTRGRGRVDYLIMPTVYGDISYLKNVDFLKRNASRVVICTSKYESGQFYQDLENACKKYGLRFVAVDLPKTSKGEPIKNAYTIYKGAFTDLDALGVTPNTPCILIDADTTTNGNLNDLARTFVKSGVDVASLRCEVANVTSLLEILQEYEYRTAMDNRRMDPWLTSGACNMARAETFRHVFQRHSHFFIGGDIEIGKLAQTMGYKMGHIDFTFYTEVPSKFRDWFKQRTLWFAGGVRHHVANIGNFSWHHFFIFFYNSLIVYLLLPLRWIEMVHFPLVFFLLVLISWIYIFIVNAGRGWRKEYLALPVYAFIQSMVILPLAFVRYARFVVSQRSLGLLRQDLSHLNWRLLFASRFLNIATAAIVLVFAFQLTTARVEYWLAKDSAAIARHASSK